MKPFFSFLILCLTVSFASAEETPALPSLRLDGTARPVKYQAELTIVPGEETFSGEITIEIEFHKATSFLWLNGTDLTIQQSEILAAGETISVQPISGNQDFIGFSFSKAIAAGPARMHLRYQGKIYRKDMSGLFQQEDRNNWYVFSDFEATDARRAFPCFDEPLYKVPWRLTLKVKQDQVAASNTPILSETAGEGGMKRVTFAETKPISSYLLALAVGPFDFVDAEKAGKKGTPIRIVTPRGHGSEARWAAQTTPEILVLLENYFGIPYPYEKLDLIAVPKMGGAMENPGLITYSQRLLLMKPEEETIQGKRVFADICAHELAHQWFGNLVTMVWWDDVWLNESFASWMASKIIDQWKPEWDDKVARVRSRLRAMEDDSLVTARRIRQPIQSNHDIRNAFDNITYGKGEAILEMFESWIGEEKFRKGVQEYLDKHAWKNATADDFLGALSSAAGQDVIPPFSTFLDQTGVPLISARLHCEKDGLPRLKLSQKRYLPAGSQGSDQQTWKVPVCVSYGTEKVEGRECLLMKSPQAELSLLSARGCPDWVVANDEGTGYYHVLYEGDLLQGLLKEGGKRLSVPERVGLIGDLEALMDSGQIPVGSVLGEIPALLQDSNRHVIAATSAIVSRLNDHLVPPELRPNYARFIRKMYGPKAWGLGWQPKPGDDENTRLLRINLLSLVAGEGEDRELAAEAEKLARAWLQNRRAVDADLVGVVLETASRYGNGELFDAYYDELKKAKDLTERRHLLAAMGSFLDPEIIKTAFGVILSDEIDIRESMAILRVIVPETRLLVYDFVKQNFDSLAARMPRDYAAFLLYTGAGLCDPKSLAEMESAFGQRATQLTGGPRILAHVLEIIRLCSSITQIQQPAVITFLKNY